MCWPPVGKFYDINIANESPIAAEAFDQIGRLYAIEAEICRNYAMSDARLRRATAITPRESLCTEPDVTGERRENAPNAN